MSVGHSISVGCMNCRGLADKYKRNDVFNWFRNKRFDISVLIDSHCNAENENKWKAEWGNEVIYASVAGDSRGIAILFGNSFSYEIHSIKRVLNNNAIIIDLTIDIMRISFVAIYAPNKDSPDFFTELQEEIDQLHNHNIIICGDYNVVQNYELDTYKYKTKNNPKAQEQLLKIMDDIGYQDIWRFENPGRKLFTWKGPAGKRSRLDYFLVSQNLCNICNRVSITPGYRTDHELITLELELSKQTRGRGVWKFNNQLLTDHDFVNSIKNCILENEIIYKSNDINDEYTTESIKFNISDQLFYETLKIQIRGLAIEFSSRKKKIENKREKDIENEIQKIFDQDLNDQTEKLRNDLENELEQIREKHIKGNILRSKANWIQHGEKCSKYFCNLEKKKYTEKLMYKLVGENGCDLTNTKDIMDEQTRFYSKLYSEKTNLSDTHIKKFLDNDNPYIEKLSEDEKVFCDADLSQAECLLYLKSMKNDKSPGMDGFTVEFYKFFWKDIGVYMFRSLKHAIASGELSVTQKQGTITLLPKGNKSKLTLKNWRPITLMNVDYKIFSGAVSFRLKNILKRIIGDTQKGFLEGRDISECTRLIYDVLHASKEKQLTGLLLKIDFEKAFDSVSHEFIDKCLNFLGFGMKFRQYIKMLYKNATSCILYNGHISNFFKVKSGVRQGDPLSPYIFIIAISTLIAAILYAPNIKGITIDDSEYLLTFFADDGTLFLEGSSCNLQNTMDIFTNFKTCSGIGVNFEKTEILWIGDRIGSERIINTSKELKWLKDPIFEILGITYNLRDDDITKSNYDTKLKSIKSLLATWSWRNLTLFGKITVIKSLAIPMIVHLLRALPSPDHNFFKEANNIIYKFIWDNKPDKIKRSVLINDYSAGGTNLIHLESFAKSMKIFWVKKILNDTYNTEWKTLILDKIQKFGGNYIWHYHSESIKKIGTKLNPFWNDVCKIWSEVMEIDKNQDILSQTVWYNPEIKVGNKTIYYKNYSDAGINYIRDLLDDDGNFLDHRDLMAKYDITPDFLTHGGILHAIPVNWKNIILDMEEVPQIIKSVFLANRIAKLRKPNKIIYTMLIDSITERPEKAEIKWHQTLGIDKDEMSEYYNVHKKVFSRDTLLRAFQYKICNRILATNRLLFKMNISPYDLCTFCSTHSESIRHLFWECNVSKTLWCKIFEELDLYTKIPSLKLNEKIVIFGYIEKEQPNANIFLNMLLIITKQYIYKCKMGLSNPNIEEARKYILFRSDQYISLDDKLEISILQPWRGEP